MTELLSIPETAATLGVGRSSIYKLIDQQRLPSVKLGRRRLISRADLAKFIDELRESGAA